MKSADGFDKIPNKMMVALMTYDFTVTQYKVVLYVLHKTCGWNKNRDRIAISKMARDLGKHRQMISRTVLDLSKMNVLEVVREREVSIPEMRVLEPENWDRGATVEFHATAGFHATVESTGCNRTVAGKCNRGVAYKRHIYRDTIQETGELPSNLVKDEITTQELIDGGWTIV